MLIVNFHEHPAYYAEENCRDFGIHKAVLLPVGNESIEKAVAMAEKEPDKYIPFGWFDKDKPIKDELERINDLVNQHGIKGIKFHPMIQHIYPDDKRLYPLYEFCQEKGLVILWHAGIVTLGFKYQIGEPLLVRYSDPLGFDQVAFDFPELKICIAHLGGNYIYTALVLAEKHENIYLDTAFLTFFAPRFFPPVKPEDMITHAVKVAGADKILYGCEGVSPQHVLNANISDSDKEKILGLNAVKLLGL